MEYSESIVSAGVIHELTCPKCGNQEHEVKGIVKYAFFFIESLPFFPVSKRTEFQCQQCWHKVEGSKLSKATFTSFQKRLFPFWRLPSKFIGILLVALIAMYAANTQLMKVQAYETYINAPKINDFYHIDYRMLDENLRPHEKYRLAKIIDITDDIATLTFSRMYYRFQHSADESIRVGHTRHFSFFTKKEYHYSFADLKAMKASGIIYKIERPIGNKLRGKPVFAPIQTFNSRIYFPGARQNNSGLAFQSATFLENHQQSAFEQFLASAERGYKLGQVNVAEMYILGKHGEQNFEQALYWLKQAAFQDYKVAIDKYLIVCEKVQSCNKQAFFEELRAEGVNFKRSL